MRPWPVALLVSSLLSLVAGKSIASDVDDELHNLQGEWVSVSFDAARTPKDTRKLTMVFKGKKVTLTVDDKTHDTDCDLDVDHDPKWMDIVVRYGTYISSVNQGIYSRDGDTLTICHGGGERPTKFEVRQAESSIDSLIVLKRRR